MMTKPAAKDPNMADNDNSPARSSFIALGSRHQHMYGRINHFSPGADLFADFLEGLRFGLSEFSDTKKLELLSLSHKDVKAKIDDLRALHEDKFEDICDDLILHFDGSRSRPTIDKLIACIDSADVRQFGEVVTWSARIVKIVKELDVVGMPHNECAPRLAGKVKKIFESFNVGNYWHDWVTKQLTADKKTLTVVEVAKGAASTARMIASDSFTMGYLEIDEAAKSKTQATPAAHPPAPADQRANQLPTPRGPPQFPPGPRFPTAPQFPAQERRAHQQIKPAVSVDVLSEELSRLALAVQRQSEENGELRRAIMAGGLRAYPMQGAAQGHGAPYRAAYDDYPKVNAMRNQGGRMGHQGHALCPYCPVNMPFASRDHCHTHCPVLEYDIARGYVYLNDEGKPLSIVDGNLLPFDSVNGQRRRVQDAVRISRQDPMYELEAAMDILNGGPQGRAAAGVTPRQAQQSLGAHAIRFDELNKDMASAYVSMAQGVEFKFESVFLDVTRDQLHEAISNRSACVASVRQEGSGAERWVYSGAKAVVRRSPHLQGKPVEDQAVIRVQDHIKKPTLQAHGTGIELNDQEVVELLGTTVVRPPLGPKPPMLASGPQQVLPRQQ